MAGPASFYVQTCREGGWGDGCFYKLTLVALTAPRAGRRLRARRLTARRGLWVGGFCVRARLRVVVVGGAGAAVAEVLPAACPAAGGGAESDGEDSDSSSGSESEPGGDGRLSRDASAEALLI